MRNRNSNPRRFWVEPLEAKTLLAGDVSASVIDGNLVVHGDMEGNHIALTSADAPGAVLVGGLTLANGDVTTVNGMTGRVRFEGVRNSILIGLGEGDDSIGLHGLAVHGNLAIRMDGGDDRIQAGRPVHDGNPNGPPGPGVRVGGHISVNMGDGNDRIAILHSAFATLHVDLGAGDDGLALGHNQAHLGVTLQGGRGEDTLANLGWNRFPRLRIAGFEHRGHPANTVNSGTERDPPGLL